jgi:anti-sigma-K factor RskA
MTGPRSTPEVEELIGAYALDAVDPDERDAVERHLDECPRCRTELAGHLEVAALLGNTGAPAPDGVWARIASSLEEPPPAMRLSLAPPPVEATDGTRAASPSRPHRRWVTRSFALAAAAAVAVIALLGVDVVRQDHRIDQMRDEIAASADSTGLQGAMVAAMSEPTSQEMNLASPTGAPMSATAVMTEDGTGYFLTASMPALPEGRTYQLWGVMADGQVVSLGVLGRYPHMAAFQASGGLTGLAVTEEVTGGVPQSQNPAVLKA